nr:hypothetical protein Iba_scaffold21040CG0250 [Ipomoea batatas]
MNKQVQSFIKLPTTHIARNQRVPRNYTWLRNFNKQSVSIADSLKLHIEIDQGSGNKDIGNIPRFQNMAMKLFSMRKPTQVGTSSDQMHEGMNSKLGTRFLYLRRFEGILLLQMFLDKRCLFCSLFTSAGLPKGPILRYLPNLRPEPLEHTHCEAKDLASAFSSSTRTRYADVETGARLSTPPPANEEAGQSCRRGKSPRVVLSSLYPSLSPSSVAYLTSTLQPGSSAPPVESSNADRPSLPRASPGTKQVFLNKEGMKQHTCFLNRIEIEDVSSLFSGRIPFRTRRDFLTAPRSRRSPKEYASTQLQAPGYDREEKYVQKPAAVTIAIVAPTSGSSVGTSRQDHPGAKKTVTAPAAPTKQAVLTAPPLGVAQTASSSSDLQIIGAYSKCGKENAMELDVEEVALLKRVKRLTTPNPTSLLDNYSS